MEYMESQLTPNVIATMRFQIQILYSIFWIGWRMWVLNTTVMATAVLPVGLDGC